MLLLGKINSEGVSTGIGKFQTISNFFRSLFHLGMGVAKDKVLLIVLYLRKHENCIYNYLKTPAIIVFKKSEAINA